jgi:hypothetical protein
VRRSPCSGLRLRAALRLIQLLAPASQQRGVPEGAESEEEQGGRLGHPIRVLDEVAYSQLDRRVVPAGLVVVVDAPGVDRW